MTRPHQAPEGRPAASRATFTTNRALADRGAAAVRGRARSRSTGVDVDAPAPIRRSRLGAARPPRHADRPARASPSLKPMAPLRAAERKRTTPSTWAPYPARLLHDEAQPAPQRSDGAVAGLRRHPPAATDNRAWRARSRLWTSSAALAHRDDRHAAPSRMTAESRRAWRDVRHDGDQAPRWRSARRGGNPHGGARARQRRMAPIPRPPR